MDKKPPKKRKYDSTRRQAQARETRRQIAAAARRLFLELGYHGTTLDAIAQAAAVATETVYAIFGSKRKILWYLIDTAIGGDEEPVGLMDRDEPQAVLHDTHPARQIHMFSQGVTGILARAAPVMEVLKSAARTDHELAGLQDRMLAERKENMARFAQALAGNHGLREGVNADKAGVLVWTLTSPEVFLLLTRDRDYSAEQYAAWLEDTLSRLLLP